MRQTKAFAFAKFIRRYRYPYIYIYRTSLHCKHSEYLWPCSIQNLDSQLLLYYKYFPKTTIIPKQEVLYNWINKPLSTCQPFKHCTGSSWNTYLTYHLALKFCNAIYPSSISNNSHPHFAPFVRVESLKLTFGLTFWPHFNTPSSKDFIMTDKTKALTTFENSLCETPKPTGNTSPKPIHLLLPSRRHGSPLAMALFLLPHTLHMTSN